MLNRHSDQSCIVYQLLTIHSCATAFGIHLIQLQSLVFIVYCLFVVFVGNTVDFFWLSIDPCVCHFTDDKDCRQTKKNKNMQICVCALLTEFDNVYNTRPRSSEGQGSNQLHLPRDKTSTISKVLWRSNQKETTSIRQKKQKLLNVRTRLFQEHLHILSMVDLGMVARIIHLASR